jgi:hypothetical protein
MSLLFNSVKMEIFLVIRPKYLNEPAVGIFKDISQFLLKYSQILSGFPLSFEIEGVKPTGKILEDGSIYANCLINFCVFSVKPGTVLQSVDGYVNGIFPVEMTQEGNDNFEAGGNNGVQRFTGDFVVKKIEEEKLFGGRMVNGIEEEEDEF